MKKVMFLLATLLIGGMMFTGCKKDNTPGSDPASKTFKVSYALGNKTSGCCPQGRLRRRNTSCSKRPRFWASILCLSLFRS